MVRDGDGGQGLPAGGQRAAAQEIVNLLGVLAGLVGRAHRLAQRPGHDDRRVVLQTLANPGQIDHHVDAVLGEMGGRADAGEHQQLWGVHRAGGQDHRAAGAHDHRRRGAVRGRGLASPAWVHTTPTARPSSTSTQSARRPMATTKFSRAAAGAR